MRDRNDPRKSISSEEFQKLIKSGLKIHGKFGNSHIPNPNGLQRARQKKRKTFQARRGSLHGPTGKEKGRAGNTAFLLFGARVSGNQRRDLDGMLSTVLDCAVQAGALEDDNLGIVSAGLVGHLKVPVGEEGFDLVIVEELE